MNQIIAKYNPIDLYANKGNRRWNLTDNREQYIILYESGQIPAMQLIVDEATTATLQLMDQDDNAVGSPVSFTIESASDYDRLIHTGTTLADPEDGYYYLEITIDGTAYYSEMFGWTSDTSELLKLEITDLANFDLGGYYTMNMDGYSYLCYFDAEYNGVKPDVVSDDTDNSGVSDISSGSRTLVRTFLVDGHEYIYEFLSGLRILNCNGTVAFTYLGREFTASDIDIDTEDELVNGDMYRIKVEFKVRNETISTNNKVY